MKRKFIGYAILVAVNAVALPFADEYGTWLPIVAAVVAIALALYYGEISFLGIAVVFVFMNLLVPAAVLYWVGLQAKMDAPLRELFEHYEWVRAALPWCFAMLAYGAITQIKKRAASKIELP
jgi:uncharacterized membrane protein YfbV (UPF0208 family)